MNKPIEYEQYDRRWKNVMYSNHGDRSQTIGTSGCGPTCAAMVIATLRDKSVTPIQTCDWAVKNGFRTYNDGTAWTYFKAQFVSAKIPCRQTGNVSEALNALQKNRMVITAAAKGIWTSSGHFILAYGYDPAKGRVYIHDPNSEQAYRELADVNKYRTQTTQYWIIEEYFGGVEDVDIKKLQIKDLDHDTKVTVDAVNINGVNYVKLRDMERLAPLTVSNEGAVPTIKLNYK